METSVDVVQVDTLVWRLLFLEWTLVVGGYGEEWTRGLSALHGSRFTGGGGRQFQDPSRSRSRG